MIKNLLFTSMFCFFTVILAGCGSLPDSQKTLSGKVIAISNETSLLVINLGTTHNVKAGDEFAVLTNPVSTTEADGTISQEFLFIATIKIDRVLDANNSACQITRSDGPIKLGDTVLLKK